MLLVKLLKLLILSLVTCVAGSDYSTSPAAIQKLFKVEQQLLSVYANYVTLLEKRIEKVKAYLEDYEDSILAGRVNNKEIGIKSKLGSEEAQNSINDLTVEKNQVTDLDQLSIDVSSHPLKTYRLIRRFVIQLQDLEKDFGNQQEKELLNTLDEIRHGIQLPRVRDLQGSIEGLLRVQDAYDLNITEFSKGRFQGLETNSQLTARDCHEVGIYALNVQIYTRSIEWLQQSLILVTQGQDDTISAQQVLNDLKGAIVQHDDTQNEDPTNIYVYRKPVISVRKLLAHRKDRLEKVADTRQHVLYKEQENIQDLYNFASLCSGKLLQVQSKPLKCFLQQAAGVPIVAEKIEFLHTNPDVVQVYNFLSNAAIDDVLKMATPTMTRSKVQGPTIEAELANTRTSTSTWIRENVGNGLKTLPFRIRGLTGLHTFHPNSAEDLQISSYGIGGHYNPHLDLLFQDYVPEPEERAKGDRIATFLFYLSDVPRGGGTAFPRLGIIAKPVKGSAIFWYNLRSDGSADQLSLHGGCPVIYGTKYVANKWIRANAQFQSRKCTPDNRNH